MLAAARGELPFEYPQTAGELAAFLRRYDDRRATQGAYALDLADWCVWLARAGTGPLEATLATIESYKRDLLLDGKAPALSTMARRLACLSHFYRRAQYDSGHVVAVHGDELYDLLAPTRGGYGRLQDFGVRFGYERVVIHLQPHLEPHRLQANTARTMLLLDHEPLPRSRWGEEFAAAMPDEIRRLQEYAASTDATPRQDAIRSRVASILPLYRLSRYRPTPAPRPSPATGDRDDPLATTRRVKPTTAAAPPTEDAHRTITGDRYHPPATN